MTRFWHDFSTREESWIEPPVSFKWQPHFLLLCGILPAISRHLCVLLIVWKGTKGLLYGLKSHPLFLHVFVKEQHNRKLLNVFYLEIAINQKTRSQTPNLVSIPFPLVSFTHYLFNKWWQAVHFWVIIAYVRWG